MTFDPTAWQQADINSSNEDRATAPDPGTYIVALEDGKAFTSKAGNATIVLDLRVTGGPRDGHQWSELRGFGNDGQIKAAKATCARIGVDVDQVGSLEEIDDGLKEHVGTFYEIEVTRNGKYLNVYVQGRATEDSGSTDIPAGDTSGFETATAGAAVDPDDIPF